MSKTAVRISMTVVPGRLPANEHIKPKSMEVTATELAFLFRLRDHWNRDRRYDEPRIAVDTIDFVDTRSWT